VGGWVDIAISASVVLGAGVFLYRRFRSPKAPACAPDGRAQPQVILGSRLAKAMGRPKH
jgi:hypothetical protein